MNKKCPNCGREVDANAKFCTYCGYRFVTQSSSQVNDNEGLGSANPQPKQSATNNGGNQNPNPEPSQFEQDVKQRGQEAKQFSNNYFQWLMATLKHPTKVPDDSHKYFGITSFVLSFVLIGLFIKVALKNVTTLLSTIMGSAFTSMMNSGSDGSSLSGDYNSAMNSIFNHLFVFILIELVVVTLIAFVIRKGIYHDRVSFLGFLNEFASYANYALVMELVGVVFLALNVFNVGSIVLFGFTMFAYSLAAYYSVFKLPQSSGFDKIYSVLIGAAVQGLITYVLVTSLIY